MGYVAYVVGIKRSIIRPEAVSARGAGVEHGGTFICGSELERVVVHLVVGTLGAAFVDDGTVLEFVFGDRGFHEGLLGPDLGGERVFVRGGDDFQVLELGRVV